MFGEFNEATQLKTSLAEYSIEINDLAVQMHPHRIAYLRLLGRPYTLLDVRNKQRKSDNFHGLTIKTKRILGFKFSQIQGTHDFDVCIAKRGIKGFT